MRLEPTVKRYCGYCEYEQVVDLKKGALLPACTSKHTSLEKAKQMWGVPVFIVASRFGGVDS